MAKEDGPFGVTELDADSSNQPQRAVPNSIRSATTRSAVCLNMRAQRGYGGVIKDTLPAPFRIEQVSGVPDGVLLVKLHLL